MADKNKTNPEKFYSEILSPSELFAARSRSHKIPVRGQKDFFPNDSEEQKQRLEQSLNEHWSLVSEERVERLGNLVTALWVQNEQIVELQTPAGKFWQTMGFSANGKQYLHPEEALYLMECGNLQVFEHDLPMSIQDGYEKFLSPQSLTLQQYQVFGHLKRLGYVVTRFHPSPEASSYARQLNLPKPHGRRLKRKRSASPTTLSSHTDLREEHTCEEPDDIKCTHDGNEDNSLQSDHPTCPEATTFQTSAASSADTRNSRSWWMTDAFVGVGQKSEQCSTAGSRWDFSVILFPDLGSRRLRHSCLSSPDPSLLPGMLSVGDCDVTPWIQRINLREVKMSTKEVQREQHQLRHQRNVNKDKKVQQCRNWTEYRELQERRQGKLKGQAAHLWNREVSPLHDPRQEVTTEELLEKISVIKSTNLLEGSSRLKASDEWRICFNVYQPDVVTDFKKSNPGKPYSHMCVCSFDGPVPDLGVLKHLASQSADVPVVFAVVDYGDISFYTFKDFHLPTDVYQ
ncbi:tRNA-splicing endonuclease subunit Sen54 [Thalassophryne amazonica]|uniref:tRNA-splicing endonuclease subunit Sen54 n=1 Tax=Thalassophryne amazonica TaxID=390379 RepID=UPI00147247CE|nr:tRNA-splicing endonuclease subunit Sen54 [Thalassophryne amazonica]